MINVSFKRISLVVFVLIQLIAIWWANQLNLPATSGTRVLQAVSHQEP